MRSSFAYDPEGLYHFVGSGGGGGGGYGLTIKPGIKFSIRYVLGLLNSRLLDWCVKLVSSRFAHGYYSFNRQYIEPIPIRPIDFSDRGDVQRHDLVVQLVNRMLDLHKRLEAAKVPEAKVRLTREIDATDRQMDDLVYELYELTPEEIRIVEGAS
jgi:hypothetical protein